MTQAGPVTVRRGRRVLGLLGRAYGRIWGRDVMLYVGGVSFFALLAIFPALSLLIGLYSVVFTPEQAVEQGAVLAQIVPQGARAMIQTELTRLTDGSTKVVGYQSLLALVIGAYAAHRGVKALLAGLTFIHDEDEPLGFVRFNVLAFIVAIAAFAFVTAISGAIVVIKILEKLTDIEPLERTFALVHSEWVWASVGTVVGLSLLYRFAMSHSGRVDWRAAIIGAVAATVLSLAASWASAFYVDQIVELGATYGSVGAVVVMLIWLSWNVNAVFYGGALATEVEILLDARKAATAESEPEGLSLSPKRAFRP